MSDQAAPVLHHSWTQDREVDLEPAAEPATLAPGPVQPVPELVWAQAGLAPLAGPLEAFQRDSVG